MVTPAPLVGVEMRRRDMLAEAARARLIALAAPTGSLERSRPKRRPLTLVRAYARSSLAALASVALHEHELAVGATRSEAT